MPLKFTNTGSCYAESVTGRDMVTWLAHIKKLIEEHTNEEGYTDQIWLWRLIEDVQGDVASLKRECSNEDVTAALSYILAGWTRNVSLAKACDTGSAFEERGAEYMARMKFSANLAALCTADIPYAGIHDQKGWEHPLVKMADESARGPLAEPVPEEDHH